MGFGSDSTPWIISGSFTEMTEGQSDTERHRDCVCVCVCVCEGGTDGGRERPEGRALGQRKGEGGRLGSIDDRLGAVGSTIAL